jgi:transposase
MRNGVEVRLGPGDRERLDRVVCNRNRPQKHAWRAPIIVMTADGCTTMAIREATGKAKPTIWRWQGRYMAAGFNGLFKDAPRGRGMPKLDDAVIRRVVDTTLHEKPPHVTHRSVRRLSKHLGISHGSVQRIWRAHGPSATISRPTTPLPYRSRGQLPPTPSSTKSTAGNIC